MRRRVGALCLSSLPPDEPRCRDAERSHSTEDRHKALTSTPLLPLSLHDEAHVITGFGCTCLSGWGTHYRCWSFTSLQSIWKGSYLPIYSSRKRATAGYATSRFARLTRPCPSSSKRM